MLPQLDPTWYASQLFWLVVCVLVMHLLLAHVVLPRLHAVVQGRATFTTVALEEAERFKRNAEDARLKYEQALADARAQANALLADAERRIKQAQADAETRVNSTMHTRMIEAQSQRAAHMQALRTQLEQDAVGFVGDIVDRVAGIRPDGTKAASALRTHS